jgi:hypothetical protein
MPLPSSGQAPDAPQAGKRITDDIHPESNVLGDVCDGVGGAAVSHSASGRLHATCLSAPRSSGAPESVNQPILACGQFVLKLFCHFRYAVCKQARQNELSLQRKPLVSGQSIDDFLSVLKVCVRHQASPLSRITFTRSSASSRRTISHFFTNSTSTVSISVLDSARSSTRRMFLSLSAAIPPLMYPLSTHVLNTMAYYCCCLRRLGATLSLSGGSYNAEAQPICYRTHPAGARRIGNAGAPIYVIVSRCHPCQDRPPRRPGVIE